MQPRKELAKLLAAVHLSSHLGFFFYCLHLRPLKTLVILLRGELGKQPNGHHTQGTEATLGLQSYVQSSGAGMGCSRLEPTAHSVLFTLSNGYPDLTKCLEHFCHHWEECKYNIFSRHNSAASSTFLIHKLFTQ